MNAKYLLKSIVAQVRVSIDCGNSHHSCFPQTACFFDESPLITCGAIAYIFYPAHAVQKYLKKHKMNAAVNAGRGHSEMSQWLSADTPHGSPPRGGAREARSPVESNLFEKEEETLRRQHDEERAVLDSFPRPSGADRSLRQTAEMEENGGYARSYSRNIPANAEHQIAPRVSSGDYFREISGRSMRENVGAHHPYADAVPRGDAPRRNSPSLKNAYYALTHQQLPSHSHAITTTSRGYASQLVSSQREAGSIRPQSPSLSARSSGAPRPPSPATTRKGYAHRDPETPRGATPRLSHHNGGGEIRSAYRPSNPPPRRMTPRIDKKDTSISGNRGRDTFSNRLQALMAVKDRMEHLAATHREEEAALREILHKLLSRENGEAPLSGNAPAPRLPNPPELAAENSQLQQQLSEYASQCEDANGRLREAIRERDTAIKLLETFQLEGSKVIESLHASVAKANQENVTMLQKNEMLTSENARLKEMMKRIGSRSLHKGIGGFSANDGAKDGNEEVALGASQAPSKSGESSARRDGSLDATTEPDTVSMEFHEEVISDYQGLLQDADSIIAGLRVTNEELNRKVKSMETQTRSSNQNDQSMADEESTRSGSASLAKELRAEKQQRLEAEEHAHDLAAQHARHAGLLEQRIAHLTRLLYPNNDKGLSASMTLSDAVRTESDAGQSALSPRVPTDQEGETLRQDACMNCSFASEDNHVKTQTPAEGSRQAFMRCYPRAEIAPDTAVGGEAKTDASCLSVMDFTCKCETDGLDPNHEGEAHPMSPFQLRRINRDAALARKGYLAPASTAPVAALVGGSLRRDDSIVAEKLPAELIADEDTCTLLTQLALSEDALPVVRSLATCSMAVTSQKCEGAPVDEVTPRQRSDPQSDGPCDNELALVDEAASIAASIFS